jgi:hypothetical protein
MLQWLKDIDPKAIPLSDGYEFVRKNVEGDAFIVIVQTTPTFIPNVPIYLFGAEKNRYLPNDGNTQKDKMDNYTVSTTYGFDDYNEISFLANTLNSPFKLGRLRVEAQSPNFFMPESATLNYSTYDPTGNAEIKSMPLYRKLNQFVTNATEYSLEDMDIIVNGGMELTFETVPNAYIKFYFYPSVRASIKYLKKTGKLGKIFIMPEGNVPFTPNVNPAYISFPLSIHDKI